MIGSNKATAALADLLRQSTLSIERQPRVIKALGRFKDAAAIKPLLESLKSTAPTVRRPRSMLWSRSSQTRRGPRRDDVTNGVRALLTDPAADVRNRAIAAAGALGDRKAIPALIALAEQPSRASRRDWPWRDCRTFVPSSLSPRP